MEILRLDSFASFVVVNLTDLFCSFYGAHQYVHNGRFFGISGMVWKLVENTWLLVRCRLQIDFQKSVRFLEKTFTYGSPEEGIGNDGGSTLGISTFEMFLTRLARFSFLVSAHCWWCILRKGGLKYFPQI